MSERFVAKEPFVMVKKIDTYHCDFRWDIHHVVLVVPPSTIVVRSDYGWNKVRVSEAKVVAIYNANGENTRKPIQHRSGYYGYTYQVGKIARPKYGFGKWTMPCSGGIHGVLLDQILSGPFVSGESMWLWIHRYETSLKANNLSLLCAYMRALYEEEKLGIRRGTND